LNKEGTRKVEFTEAQMEILYTAWAIAPKGHGQVVQEWAEPEADELAEAGWLERRVEDSGDVSFWWTSQAETSLDLNALVR
jgi:hypothetical protein